MTMYNLPLPSHKTDAALTRIRAKAAMIRADLEAHEAAPTRIKLHSAVVREIPITAPLSQPKAPALPVTPYRGRGTEYALGYDAGLREGFRSAEELRRDSRNALINAVALAVLICACIIALPVAGWYINNPLAH